MSYIGNSLTQQSFTGGVDQFNGNASNTAFGLTRTINTNFDVDVYVENVWQRPGVGYNVSANTITFTSAPSAGSNNVVVVYKNFTATSVVPISGSVTTTTLVDGAVTPAKLSTGAPSWDSSSNHAVAGNQTIAGNQTVGAAGSILAENNLRFKSAGDSYVDHNTVGRNINFRVSNGSALDTNPLSILSTGVVSLPLGQLKFPVTQNASSDANTLDDYEEGTWTPVVTRATTAPTLTTDVLQGTYIKVGRLVHISVNLHVASVSAAGAGYNLISGLPFPADNSAAIWSTLGGSVTYNNAFATSVATGLSFGATLTGISFLPSGNSRTQSEINESWTSGYLVFAATYRTTQ